MPASRLSWGRRAGTNPRKSSPPFTSSPHKKQPNSEQKKTSLGCFIVTMYPGIIFKQLRKHPLPPAPGRKGSLDQGPLLGPRGLPSRTGVGDPPARPLPTPRKGLGAGQSSQRRAAEPPPAPASSLGPRVGAGAATGRGGSDAEGDPTSEAEKSPLCLPTRDEV